MAMMGKNSKILIVIILLQFIILVCFITVEKWHFVPTPQENSSTNQVRTKLISANQNIIADKTNQNLDLHSWATLLSDAISERNKVVKNIQQSRPDDCLSNCNDHGNLIKKEKHYTFLNKDFEIDKELFASLKNNQSPVSICDGKLKINYGSFAVMHEAIIRPYQWDLTGLSDPGKELYKFKDQSLRTDDAEVLKPKKGLLELHCPDKIELINEFSSENVLMLKFLIIRAHTTYLDENVTERAVDVPKKYEYERRFTLAIERVEYANLYHMMLHMHNIFTMLLFYHEQPVNLSLLILDSHPQAEIDSTLQTLYGPLVRVANLRRPVKFKNLVLSLPEHRSPLSKYFYDSLPHLEEFRTFVYNQHMLDETSHLDCRNLKITLIWRRDKVYHPRNLKGSVERKIFNEAEIYKALYERYPSACINGLLLESLPMKEQLKIIRQTDILIGMHGAGLTHALFLPQTSGVIELFPYQWKAIHPYYRLFEAITKWRKLHYMWWENREKVMEMPHYFTVVNVDSLVKRVASMIHSLCLDHFDLKKNQK